MADWKPHLPYNHNPSYHAYAYGLLYPNGFDQNLEVANARGNLAAPTPAYRAAEVAPAPGGSPPDSPEEHTGSGHYQYQASEFSYLRENTGEQLLFSKQHLSVVGPGAHEARQTGSDTASDSEAYISPGSWSSASSREGSQPQADCMVWAKNDQNETSSRSPDTDSCGSPTEVPRSYVVLGNQANHSGNSAATAHVEVNTPKTPTANTPKSKARANFSDSQMNILSERFSVQRYLSPSEMRNVAEVTGLTYKQVKTWFQNRRMKLRREQKSIGVAWTPDRAAPLNHPLQIPPAVPNNYFRGEARHQLKEHYTQHMMEAALKNPSSQNLAFYLATMSPNSGSVGYPPSWSPIPSMPQAPGVWSMPPGMGHYDYNSSAFNMAGGPPAEAARQDGKNESKRVDNRYPPNTARVHVRQ